jgi:translation initiation factor 1
MSNDWKDRLGVVYSTNSEFKFNTNEASDQQTLLPHKQTLRVTIEKKHRGGKTVTLIQGFVGKEDDLKDLAKLLKNKCGVGGSAKDGEIIVQGEIVDKVKNILLKEGYKVK